MLPVYNYSSSIKRNGLIKNSNLNKSSRFSSNNYLLFNNKNVNQRFSNMKSIDITSRLGQFAWRQIIPSNILLPVIFRHNDREEYLCSQMIKIHLLSNISPDIISYWMQKSPIRHFKLTIYEAQLFHHINIFHSNGTLSKNNQIDYFRLESASITPFILFSKFYQLICSTPQLINSNQFWISSQMSTSYEKSITDKEKQVVNNMCESSKNIIQKKTESNNSFCRQIIFHGREILSYCTTSSIHLNEKGNQTISCLSIKDIVSIYFPWSSIEQFIQICRKKQITRFKPDKSTDCDSTLRLVNIQELENHWNFILKELLPNIRTSFHKNNNQSETDKICVQSSEINVPLVLNSNDILSSNVNNENSTKIIELSSQETITENNSIEFVDNSIEKDKENSHSLNISQIELNDQINKSPQLLENENISEDKQEEEQSKSINYLSNKKILKRTRRRRTNYSYTSKQKRKEYFKRIYNERKSLKNQILKQISDDNQQSWINKYSIEPFSIIIDRYHLSLD